MFQTSGHSSSSSGSVSIWALGLARWETLRSLPLLWMSAVPQQPYSHCSVHRPISIHCSPIFSLRCCKSPLAGLVIYFLWACAHQHYPGFALMVPEVVSVPVPILAVSFTPHVLIRTWCCLLATYWKIKSLLPQLSSKVPSWGRSEPHVPRLLYVWSSLSAGHGIICCCRYIHPSALAPEMCTSFRAVHELACPAMYLVDHESCHWISLPSQRPRTGRD